MMMADRKHRRGSSGVPVERLTFCTVIIQTAQQ